MNIDAPIHAGLVMSPPDYGMLAKLEQPDIRDQLGKKSGDGPFGGLFAFARDSTPDELTQFMDEHVLNDWREPNSFQNTYGSLKWASILSMQCDRIDLVVGDVYSGGDAILVLAAWTHSRHILNRLHGRLRQQSYPGYSAFCFFKKQPSLVDFVARIGLLTSE